MHGRYTLQNPPEGICIPWGARAWLGSSLAALRAAPETRVLTSTTAAVTFQPGEGVTGSHLLVSARVPGITEAEFERIADEAKANCPISKALGGTTITIEAELA